MNVIDKYSLNLYRLRNNFLSYTFLSITLLLWHFITPYMGINVFNLRFRYVIYPHNFVNNIIEYSSVKLISFSQPVTSTEKQNNGDTHL